MVSDGKRALAYIVTIDEIRPITNYDRVVHARTNGWWCVVRKDEFNVGDRAIYFEIDSKVPETDERFAFLESKHYKIKTQKMCKVLSQGLLMPANLFPEVNDLDIGADVTDLLGVKYYVPEDNARKAAKPDPKAKYKSMAARHKELFRKPFIRKLMKREWGRKLLFFFFGKKKDKPLAFPTKFPYVHTTDEARCENMPWVLGLPNKFVVTEKLDGCLDGDVSVVTDNGCIKIRSIVNQKLPVNVLTWNESLKRCEYKPIQEYHKWVRVSDMYDIVVSQQGYRQGNRPKHIKCTSEHSFYVGDGKYIKAKDLQETDIIYHRSEIIDTFAKEILLGILLGDGSLSSKNGNFNGGVDFSHSIKQKEYFDEIVRLLGENVGTSTATSGYGSEMVRAHFYTNAEFKEIVNNFCIKDKKKYVSKEWAELLTPLSLAFWYMDDGTIKNADSDNVRPTMTIATNNFTYDECLNLLSALQRFGIVADIKTVDSYKGNTIYLNTENAIKFATLIAPYICESMKYKLPKSLRNIQYCLSNYIASNGSSIVPTKILSIQKINDYDNKFVFDLTVENNHNYFANGILTHNTSSTYILERKGKKKFEFYVLSRNVRQMSPDQECYHDENIYWNNAFKYDIENVLKSYLNAFPELSYVCIQGESVGKVQGNPLKLDEDDLYVFNFIRSDRGRLPSVEAKEIVESMGMKFVPILDTNYHIPNDMETFKKYATAPSAINPNVLREGIVLRDPTNDMSFKNVSNEYLLKHHS